MLSIDIPTPSEFKALAATHDDICVSLYMPISPNPHRAHANRTTFKDLAKEALLQLTEARADSRNIAALEERFEYLAGPSAPDVQDEDHIRKLQHRKPSEVDEFWKHQAHGLGVLVTPKMLRAFRLPDTLKPLTQVADRFHLTPLVRVMASPHDLFVLVLSEESARLIHVVVNMPPVEVTILGLPKSAEEATRRPSVHVRAPRGHLQNLEGEKVLLQQYARRLDQALLTAFAGRTPPLVLAAGEPIASIFRAISNYPNLVDEHMQDSDHLTDGQIADRALPILNRLYERYLKEAIARFNELKPRYATTDVSYAAHAATAGAVDTLLVDLDAIIPGLVSEIDGSVTYATDDDAETYSVVDEIARRALCTGARILGATRDELPDHAPVVAILRYKFGIISD
jgi:Bacterial archaeo-eukaryotic release factor family 11